jgi:hypothetical protein
MEIQYATRAVAVKDFSPASGESGESRESVESRGTRRPLKTVDDGP